MVRSSKKKRATNEAGDQTVGEEEQLEGEQPEGVVVKEDAEGKAAVWFLTFSIAAGAQWPYIFQDIGGGDSGELVAESCVKGVGHPPGYPLFILFNHLVMQLFPKVNRAWVANSLSTALGCSASAWLAVAVLELAPCFETHRSVSCPIYRYACSISAGLIFSLSPLVWTYTVSSEVFSLNNAILAHILCLSIQVSKRCSSDGGTVVAYMLDRWRVKPRRRREWKSKRLDNVSGRGYYSRRVRVCLAALLCGLALSNQHTSVLFIIPLVAVALGAWDWPIPPRWFAAYVVCGMLGLTPYVHLLIATPAPGTWGDTSTVSTLVRHVLRSEYGTFRLGMPSAGGVEGFWERNLAYVDDLIREQLHPGSIVLFCVVCFGMYTSISVPTKSKIGYVLLATFCFYFLVFHSLANLPLSKPMPREVQRRFWIQPHLIICLWLGLGFDRLGALGARNSRWKRMALLAGLFALVTAFISARNAQAKVFPSQAVGKYADLILRILPPTGAVLVSHTDATWNTVRYKQLCEGQGQHVTHLSFQLIPYPWFKSTQVPLYPTIHFPPLPSGVSTDRSKEGNNRLVSEFLRANWNEHELYIDMHSINQGLLGHSNVFRDGIHLLPFGPLWQVVKANSTSFSSDAVAEWRNNTWWIRDESLRVIEELKEYTFPLGSWEFAVLSLLWDGLYQRAIYLLSAALAHYGSDFALYTLMDTTDLLLRVVSVVQNRNTISWSAIEISKNAALSAARLLEHVGKIKNPTYKDKLTKEWMPAIVASLQAYRELGDRSDSVYPKFIAVLNALGK